MRRMILTGLLGGLLLPGLQAQDPTRELERELALGYDLDSILVAFQPEVDADSRAAIADVFGLTHSKTIPAIGVDVFGIPHGEVESIVSALGTLGEVRFAEPNYIRRTTFVPNDPQYNQQYGFQRINAEAAWDVTLGNAQVVVAVIDTGLDQDHPDLAGQRWVNTGEVAGNGVDDDNNGYVDDRFGYDFFGDALFDIIPPGEAAEDSNPEDDNGHGTHTAGTVGAATNNGVGVAGTASGCRVMVVRALGSILGFGYSSDIINAMIYAADNGASVISMSLGSTAFSNAELSAAAYGESLGVFIVAASGNGGDATLNYPAGYPQVMAVGATDSNDNIASFSTRGANVEVSAPGVDVLSTWLSAGYSSVSGTSMACPHAAGTSALVRSTDLGMSASQARVLMQETATDLGAAGWDQNYGNGRIDAASAVTTAPPSASQVRQFQPGDGSTLNSGSTPFGFGWTRVPGAGSYTIQVELPNLQSLLLSNLPENFFYTPQNVWNNAPSGNYRWRLAAVSPSFQVISISGWWSFTK
ncbi:MAG: S8 family peptidase [Planctomycetota bacterium]